MFVWLFNAICDKYVKETDLSVHVVKTSKPGKVHLIWHHTKPHRPASPSSNGLRKGSPLYPSTVEPQFYDCQSNDIPSI